MNRSVRGCFLVGYWLSIVVRCVPSNYCVLIVVLLLKDCYRLLIGCALGGYCCVCVCMRCFVCCVVFGFRICFVSGCLLCVWVVGGSLLCVHRLSSTFLLFRFLC